MNHSFIVQTTALLAGTLGFAMANAVPAANAVTFNQQELDQSRVIAVAVPLAQGDRYNLLILEQLSNARQCWQEIPETGGVDPLLLKFDFTKICGRSTDSNGYSMRIAGEDKGLDYRLSIAKQADHLVLLGIPSQSSTGHPIEIARTGNLSAGFLKLTLNPGWRFAKRTYQGKALGHIYLASDTMPTGADATIVASTSGSRPLFQPSNPRIPSAASRPTRPANKSFAYQSSRINGPIEIPVPDPPAIASRPFGSSFPASLPSGSLDNNPPVLPGGLLPVPSASIPMGNAGNEPDLITASTPSLDLSAMAPGASGGGSTPSSYQVAMVTPRYRVFVNTTNSSQQQTVKTLVPDAFRSSYRGQTVLQVGAFQDRGKADEMVDLLNRNGIVSILTADQ